MFESVEAVLHGQPRAARRTLGNRPDASVLYQVACCLEGNDYYRFSPTAFRGRLDDIAQAIR